MRFARELGLTDPIVGYQGGLIRAMPRARVGAARPAARAHAAAAGRRRAAIVTWTREHGLDPHLNHLERFILRADDPRADDYSAFMGARAELVPDLLEAIDHPITKILAVGEPPLPTELAPAAADGLRGRRRRDDQPPALPRVRRAGRLEGPGDPLARPAARDPARARRSRSATSGTTSRCSPRSGHGAAMPTAPGAGPGGRPLPRPGRRGRGRRPR